VVRSRPLTLLAAALLLPFAATARPLTAADDTAPPARALDWTLGSWSGVRIDGASRESEPMEMRVEAILNGAGITECLRIGTGQETYHGFSMSVFDVAAGRWERRYSNTSGHIAVLQGEVLPAGQVIWHGASPGRMRESRMVSEPRESHASDGPAGDQATLRWSRTMWVSEDRGESWRVLWRDELTRSAED
jgi:hypothetical protein